MSESAPESQHATPRLRRWIGMRRRRTPIPWFLTRSFSAVLGTLTVEGLQHLPPEGSACIVAFNHPNKYDGVMLFSVIPRHDVATLVTGKMRKLPIRRFLVEIAGGVWVEPGGSEDTMQTMLHLARDGWALMLAPEGRTTGDGGLATARRGVGFFAAHAGLQVVPVGIDGSAPARLLAWPPGSGRVRVRIRFGAPFSLPGDGTGPGNHRERQQRAADAVMCRIAALLPAGLRGAYGDDACIEPERWLAAAATGPDATPR